MKTRNTDFIQKNDLDKTCFQHYMAYGKFKNLAKRTQSEKVLRDKAFEIASNPKYDGYQRALALIVYKFFDKISIGQGIKNEIKQNQRLANQLQEKEKFILLLKIIFVVQIQLICN